MRSGSARARERVSWFEPFTTLYEWELPYAKWFLGGKLNVALQLRRPARRGGPRRQGGVLLGGRAGGRPSRRSPMRELQREVVAFANALKALGVGKGTAVGIYMGMVPELPIAMLACTRLGAPHTVVFGGFSADSLSDRVNDMGCEVIVTQDEAWRRGSTGAAEADRRRGDDGVAGRAGVPRRAAHGRRGGDGRRAATTGTTTYAAATTPRRARRSRWTPRICSS